MMHFWGRTLEQFPRRHSWGAGYQETNLIKPVADDVQLVLGGCCSIVDTFKGGRKFSSRVRRGLAVAEVKIGSLLQSTSTVEKLVSLAASSDAE